MDIYDECIEQLRVFVDNMEGLPDNYEIWGSADRPEKPLQLGVLRTLLSQS